MTVAIMLLCVQHYRADHHCPMPDELVLLCRHVAATIGYPHYDPQAAIVNYYHMDSTLAGHTDHSEFDLHSPLISIRYVTP
jgi:alkylated DNA repair protein alkB family protein 1